MLKTKKTQKPPTRKVKVLPPEDLFGRVSRILDQAKETVVRVVNHRMVLAYWHIGREIVQELQGGEDRAEYGQQVLQFLSQSLTKRYGEGFAVTNLRLFRQLYLVYSDRGSKIHHSPSGESLPEPIHHALSDELAFHPSLSWTHYRTLMQVEKSEARSFYENEAVAAGWSVRELERQIHSFYFERLLASKDKKGMVKDQRDLNAKLDPAEILKSSAVLEFLGAGEHHRLRETDLEGLIMDNLQNFLLEMGRGFSFVARQKKLRFEDEGFSVDLVFYNYVLKCFVLIDLKIGKLTHQDVGQMDSYVRMYEDLYKVPGDNPTIGLILCSQKNETIARYSVLQESKQIFASKYRLQLPTEEELIRELNRELNQISK